MTRWPACGQGLHRAIFTLQFLVSVSATAAPVLGLPIQCQPGIDCHIQNFFDHDPGPGWRDYSCGALAYNGHTGTDFRLTDVKAMQAGVNVVAAAAGIVVSVRDGEPDINVNQRGHAALQGKDAGNGVRINHGDGWETQYSHMMQGSVAVHIGQKVGTGTILGKVGLSGNTEFPHVDFTVRRHGQALDPFAPDAKECGTGQRTLWNPALAKALSYRPTGLLIAGFAATVPERDSAEAGDYAEAILAEDSAAVVFWMELFGLQRSDVLEISLTGPDRQSLGTSRVVADNNQAVWFSIVGMRRSNEPWSVGTYTGHIVLRRGDRIVIDEVRTTNLR